MKFQTLEIENFLAVGQGTVQLADRGLVLIQGRNEDDSSADSNGAGKSSVADALCWVLYGVTARGVSADAVINRKAGKGTRVAVILEDGPDRYRVERHRKHKTGKNALKLCRLEGTAPVVKIDLTLGTDKLTQERLDKLIGCSYEVFKAAVYAGQEQMPDLPGMTDKELKLLVEEAAGINILEAAYEEARSRLGMASEKRNTVKAQVDLITDRILAADVQVADALSRMSSWETERAKRLASKKVEAHEAAKLAKSVQAELDAAPVHPKDLEARIAELDARIAAVATEQNRDRELQSALSVAERDYTMANSRLLRGDADVQDAYKALQNIDGKIGCPCRECQQPLTAESIAPARAAAKLRHTEAWNLLAALDKERGDAGQRVIDARRALEAHRASMTDVSATSALRGDLNATLMALRGKEAERDRAFADVRRLIDEAQAIKVEPNPFEPLVEKVRASRTKLEADRQKGNEALEGYEAEEEIHKAVVKVFGPAGVRAHILDDVTPFLNEQTAHYLTTLSDGAITAVWSTLSRTAKGDLREKFAIDVTHATGGDSFGALSGGEKRKVRVATSLALQDLVARRASKPIELFIGDEIDDALDPAGLERLMMILEEKARERGSVFIISHNDLADWVSNQITVEKRGGVSTVIDGVTA